MKDFKAVSKVVLAYAVAVIVNMDLGIPYSENEKKLYNNFFVQAFVFFSVLFAQTENYSVSASLTLFWALMKKV
tara:strand:+ start:313 stop:534 length:222 start_codon:yes stop_codon:yes gene_type:complete